MKILLSGIALIGLLATVLPSILVFSGAVGPETHKTVMTVGMILWFAAAPFVMRGKGSTAGTETRPGPAGKKQVASPLR